MKAEPLKTNIITLELFVTQGYVWRNYLQQLLVLKYKMA